VLKSLSRLMHHVAGEPQQKAASKLRNWLAKYDEIELLVQVGEYRAGADPLADEAVERVPHVRDWLKQSTSHWSPLQKTLDGLMALVHSTR
jgi:ATP synthase in type III secretion protein N